MHEFGCAAQDPQFFIDTLREYCESPETDRGALANAMSDAIIHKRVDLAEVRQSLLDGGQAELLDALERLMDLIQPYIEEGGPEE